MTEEPTRVVIMPNPTKSMLATILLTVFFGPLGLFYASVTGGIVTLVISIPLGIFTAGFGILLMIPVCVIWGAVATNSYNKKVLAVASG